MFCGHNSILQIILAVTKNMKYNHFSNIYKKIELWIISNVQIITTTQNANPHLNTKSILVKKCFIFM